MVSDTPAPEVTIWTDDLRANLVGSVVERMGSAISVIGVGGPRELGVDALASHLGVRRDDDLRKLVIERPASYLLIATTDIAIADLLLAGEQNTTILALEPVAGDLQHLTELTGTGRHRTAAVKRCLVYLPAFSHCPGYLQAADPFDVIGTKRMVCFDNHGPTAEGSLFARLFDGWRVALRCVDLPVNVDASLIGPDDRIPDDLRRITGRMGVHARSPEGSCLVMTVTDRSGESSRSLAVLGDEAELRITNTDYDLRYVDGQEVDRGQADGQTHNTADLIVNQWRRLLDGRGNLPDDHPTRDFDALACCLACLLSARTGQAENPRKLIEINR